MGPAEAQPANPLSAPHALIEAEDADEQITSWWPAISQTGRGLTALSMRGSRSTLLQIDLARNRSRNPGEPRRGLTLFVQRL